MLALIAGSVVVALYMGYQLYGRFVANQYALDDTTTTPAERFNDGNDFVPTKKFYLLGQHFSAIAAAGPIAGPILAAQQFGWAPSLMWIVVGVIFIGAVHDLSTLVASVRHDAKSIAEVVKANLGPRAGTAMLTFIWVALIYVIVAFTDSTATTFIAGDPELEGLTFDFNLGGAVAFASITYLLLAVVMGLVERFIKPPLWLQTIIFVPATLLLVWLGTKYSTVLAMDSKSAPLIWAAIILVYCFVASLTPVWILLQPRGYLGGFVLYLALGIGIIGLFFGGFEIQQPAFKGFNVPGAGPLFPFLFVTIACGACSGFHGLVCSGTTSKQIAKESHCHPVGYGAMLMEGFVAVIALATVMIMSTKGLQNKAPGTVYGVGIGQFFAVVLGKEHLAFAVTFGAMAFSTFVFDTLDVSTRLGRYVLQELFGWTSKAGGILATFITIAVPLLFMSQASAGSYRMFWSLFGTSNQLLAALSLMGISVWLKRTGKRYWYTLIPLVFVASVTLFALATQVFNALTAQNVGAVQLMNAAIASAMFVLGVSLLFIGFRALLRDDGPQVQAASVA